MKLATVRVLESMPPGMGVDSEPIKVGPEIIFPRPDKRAWAALPPRECKTCYGRGLIDTIVREPGEKPLQVKKPCGCCWQGIALAEKLEQGRPDGVKVTLASEIRAADDPNLRRYARALKDLAREEAKLHEAEAAKQAAMAPHLARQAELESQIQSFRAVEADGEAMLENAEAAVTTAVEELWAAENALEEARNAVAIADVSAAETMGALTNLRGVIAERIAKSHAAGETAATAGAAGGKRHRIITQTRRIRDLRDRLTAIEKDLKAAGHSLAGDAP